MTIFIMYIFIYFSRISNLDRRFLDVHSRRSKLFVCLHIIFKFIFEFFLMLKKIIFIIFC